MQKNFRIKVASMGEPGKYGQLLLKNVYEHLNTDKKTANSYRDSPMLVK